MPIGGGEGSARGRESTDSGYGSLSLPRAVVVVVVVVVSRLLTGCYLKLLVILCNGEAVSCPSSIHGCRSRMYVPLSAPWEALGVVENDGGRG